MEIVVVGMGYVGCVTAACLASRGHSVIGVETNESKLELLRKQQAPVLEVGLDNLIHEFAEDEKLTFTRVLGDAIQPSTDLVFICVGTPSRTDGSLDLSHVERVVSECTSVCVSKQVSPTIVMRSTMLPGSMKKTVQPLLREGEFELKALYHPEFLREGSAIDDFNHPPKIVIGVIEEQHASQLCTVYDGFDAPLVLTSYEVAESVKYADNAFHATKIAFANEIGLFCKQNEVDAREVMDVFVLDTKLNLSARYLKPGFAFGGSCLPKDLRAITSQNRGFPLLESLLESNSRIIRSVVDVVDKLVYENDLATVALVGLSFKANTDDLRESPYVELARQISHLRLQIFDPLVEKSLLIGGNKVFLESQLPNAKKLFVSQVNADIVILCHQTSESQIHSWLSAGVYIIDLVGDSNIGHSPFYFGLHW
ncbi:MAG: nucleotide sugar dehydrogenase [Pseudomonadales bacterium]|nr:nucleotide sugar dehydrogenase [Pseudomonadales bacterium]